jgi:hypothetical protein
MYFLTLSNHHGDQQRTVGYFATLDEVIAVVEKNKFDIQEGFYDVAIIEKISPDRVYPSVLEYRFYQWNGKNFVLMQRDAFVCHPIYGASIG